MVGNSLKVIVIPFSPVGSVLKGEVVTAIYLQNKISLDQDLIRFCASAQIFLGRFGKILKNN